MGKHLNLPSEAVALPAARDRREREARMREVLAIAAEMRAHMGPDLPGSDHAWLYDDGLPLAT